MSNIKIIEGGPENDWDIREIRRATWLDTYPNTEHGITVEDVESEFAQYPDTPEGRKRQLVAHRHFYEGNTKYYMAKDEKKFVGFFIGSKGEDSNRLLAIYVLPEYQGHGIGESLINAGLKWFGDDKDIYVNVAKYNDSACGFYAKFGFVKTGKDVTDPHEALPSGKVIPEIGMVRKASN